MGYGSRFRLVHLALAAIVGAGMAVPPGSARAAALIWAFGDSLTAGYGLPPAQGFTAVLERTLRARGIDVSVRNGGIAGDTAAQARARLLWGLRGLGTRPDLVIVELGANDMLRGLPPAQTQDNLDRILATLAERRIPVLLAGMRAAPNMGPDYAAAFERLYPALARRHGVPLYPFFLDGVAGRRDLIQADGLHPDARGVGIVVARIAPAVIAALKRPCRSAASPSCRQ